MSAPHHTKALPPGALLREWKLEDVLGAGGFGIVYKGRGIYFDEVVAIKEYFPGAISDRLDGVTVTPTDSSSEQIYDLGRQKFLDEAKILWTLSQPQRHPNIVSVRSLFEIHGTAYMVMDFEQGRSLSQMLHEGRRFDEQSLMTLLRPIAEGLQRVHDAGVIHRDIKPANILVDETGRPVLIDFGAARFEMNQETNTKATFYTPPYAALEQYVRTFPQGPWTDIYALGVTLFQCVTGEKPPDVLERLHGEEGQPLSARSWPGFGRAFIRAVDAAMAIRPGDRPSSTRAWLAIFDSRHDEAWGGDADATRIAGSADITAIERAFAERAVETGLPYSGDPAVLAAVLGGVLDDADPASVLDEYGGFAMITAGSMEAHVPEWQEQFAGAAAEARRIANQVIAREAAARPGPLAARARREAHEALRAAVVQAKAQTDELDDLARLVDAAADISQLEAAVARTDQIQRSLVALDAS
ncbi:MAG TPA: serine/threonine-protein kinase, partial [Caulobacteraceae bacterium]|nr:serine/threonine-protein kinase [Caulobacteraceae bacterium]